MKQQVKGPFSFDLGLEPTPYSLSDALVVPLYGIGCHVRTVGWGGKLPPLAFRLTSSFIRSRS